MIDFLNSVLRNQQTLLTYFQEQKSGINQDKSVTLKAIINDYFFWGKLTLIKRIVDFIHQIQYTSEAKGYKLHMMTSN